MPARHPILCRPILAPLVDPLDYAAWRAGHPALALLFNGKALLWNGKFLTWRP